MSGYLTADSVETPWGRPEDLRARKLPAGPSTPREAVVRSQRERLFAAIIAATATKGYPATTVADLISLAGISRATFYEHFESKAECFKEAAGYLLQSGL